MTTATPEQIVAAVIEERRFQDAKHGEDHHEMGTWVLLIEAELNEVKHALVKGGRGRDSVRSELIQVAALCFATLEQHGLMSDNTGREI